MSLIICYEALLEEKILKVGSVMVRNMEKMCLRIPSVRSGVRRDASRRLIVPTVQYTSAKPASV